MCVHECLVYVPTMWPRQCHVLQYFRYCQAKSYDKNLDLTIVIKVKWSNGLNLQRHIKVLNVTIFTLYALQQKYFLSNLPNYLMNSVCNRHKYPSSEPLNV